MLEDGTQLTMEEFEMAAKAMEENAEKPALYKELRLEGDQTIAIANILVENMPVLTLPEWRLFDTIVAELPSFKGVKEDADPLKVMDSVRFLSIRVGALSDLWGVDKRNIYVQVKKALHGLSSKPFSFEYIDSKGKRHFFSASILASAQYQEGQAQIYAELSSNFAPFLLVLKKNFTTMKFSQVITLSKNARCVYELLAQYRSIGGRSMSVAEFKKKIGMQNKYVGNNYNLKKKVLEPVSKEISEKTDMIVRYDVRGKGENAVVDFAFVLKENYNSKKIPSKVSKRDAELLFDLCTTMLDTSDFNEKDIRKMCDFSLSYFSKKEDPVSDAFACFTNAFSEYKRKKDFIEINNPAGYLSAILKAMCEERL